MRTIRTRGALGAAALICALWAPAVASAAEKPVVTTGGAANIAPTSVVLKATVNPKGAETTYFFQYGTDRHLRGADAEHERRQGNGGRPGRRRGRRAGARDDVPLPGRSDERQGPDAGQGPHVQDQAPAARRQSWGDAQPDPHRRRDVAGRRAHRHRQRRRGRYSCRPTRGRTRGFVAAGNAQVTGAGRRVRVPVLGVSAEHAVPRADGLEPERRQPGGRGRDHRQGDPEGEGRPRRSQRPDPLPRPRDAGTRRPAGADPEAPQRHLGHPRPDDGPPRRHRLLALQQAHPRPPRRPLPRGRERHHRPALTEPQPQRARAPRARLHGC